jgi:hypothetical protein
MANEFRKGRKVKNYRKEIEIQRKELKEKFSS